MSYLNRKKIEKLYYAEYIDEEGNKKTAISTSKDKALYIAFRTAYNPDFEDTLRIVRVNEDELFPNTRHHTKDIIIVDGDEESYAGFILSTKKKKKNRHNNAILDEHQTLLTKKEQPQYIEKKIIIDERYNDKLLKVDRKSKVRKVFDYCFALDQIDIIKKTSVSEANCRQSREYRKRKIKK